MMAAPRDARPGLAARFAAVLVRGYQYGVSPWLGVHCRYQPTCSEYARGCLHRHGFWRGGGYALRRIARCHPWGGSGYDPVPGSDPAANTVDDAADEGARDR